MSADQQTPAVPKYASTVLFVRDGADGLELYLIRRVKAMAFAGGMTAYPGGGVDPRDMDAEFGWIGPGVDFWAEVFGCDERTARALVAAAVRETFEEAGILLATAGDSPVMDVDTDEWEAERLALLGREQSLAEMLNKRGLSVRADLVRPWARWVTPEQEPKRYDTAFFLMKLPDGVHPREISTEHDQAEWISVQTALDQADAGERNLMPPTRVTMSDLLPFGSADAALAGAPTGPLPTVQPRLVKVDGVLKVELPDGRYLTPSVKLKTTDDIPEA